MLNSQYFQPMVHRPLPDIRRYSLLTNQHSEFYAIVKPAGVDVYINDGKIYDLQHNELENQYLKFHFEKLLKVSVDNKMTAVGTLSSPSLLSLLRSRHTLYGKTRSAITDIKFIVYDVVFPVFNSEHVYKWRYDIAAKVIGTLSNCAIAHMEIVKDEHDLMKTVHDLFAIDTGASIIAYKSDGKFIPGISQLTYEDADTVSYIVEAKQRYRAHIKKIQSTTLRMDNGEKHDIALYIIAKFKREFVEIPIDQSNLALRIFIWENRHALKKCPFWFTGYTLLDKSKGSEEYVTIINEFLSFISSSSLDEK